MGVQYISPTERNLVELPSFDVAKELPTEEAIQAFERDGVVCLRNAFSSAWVDLLSEGMEIAINDSMLMQLPTPLLCIRSTPRLSPR